MNAQKKTDPISMRIAVRIRPSRMCRTILRAVGVQSHKIDKWQQE